MNVTAVEIGADELLVGFTDARARADRLGLAGELLCRAHDDAVWRRAVEQALAQKGPLGKLLTGGSKPGSVWGRSLLHNRVVGALKDDPAAFRHFAGLNPLIAGIMATDGEKDPSSLAVLNPLFAVLGAFAVFPDNGELKVQTLNAACDSLEEASSRCSEETLAREDAAAGNAVPESTPAAHAHGTEELRVELGHAQVVMRQSAKRVHELERDLGMRVREVARKDRKCQELRTSLKAATLECEVANAGSVAMRAERDECRRQVDKLKALVKSSKQGQRTVEIRRVDESQRLQETASDLRQQLAASSELERAIEKRLLVVETELDDERGRRVELEETFEAFGMGDLPASSRSLQSALDALMVFRDGIDKYSARQLAKEQERLGRQQEAELERQAAAEARRVQEQTARAWGLREKDRLDEMERTLFPDGEIGHIIIDGHNLVHRVFRPEDEARTRPWLEGMVERMSLRLEDRGWASQIHLVFDSHTNSNSRAAGHGLRVYFHNNVTDGGADACIAQLLRDGNPRANYMVVSTDRKHVWTDALELARSEGTEIDLVQIELLAQYLQTLDEVEA